MSVSFANDSGSGSGSTGADGAFAFDTVCGSGTVTLSGVLAGSNVPTSFTIRGSAVAAESQEWHFHLPPVVQVALTVTRPDGSPVTGATVRQTEDPSVAADPAPVLDGAAPFGVGMQLEDRATDTSGRVTITTFPMAAMDLTIEPPTASDLLPQSLTVDARTDTSTTVTLPAAPPPANVSGRVLDRDGVGVPGVNVHLTSAGRTGYAVSSVDGSFALTAAEGAGALGGGLGDDSPRAPLRATLPSNFSFRSVPIRVGPDGAAVPITLPRVTRTRVTVLSANGEPVEGATVQRQDGEPFTTNPQVLVPGTQARSLDVYVSTAPTQAEGLARFNIFPTTVLDGLVARWRAPNGTWLSAPVPTLDGRVNNDITVRLPPPPTNNSLVGTLTTHDGRPVPGVYIGISGRGATTDSQGGFSIVANGGHQTLTIARGGGEDNGGERLEGVPDSFVVTAPLFVGGDTTLPLRLPQAHSVDITVTDPTTGLPVEGAHVGSGDTEPFAVAGVVLDAAGTLVAKGDVYVNGPRTDTAGHTSFLTWSVGAIPQVVVTGRSGSVALRARVHQLEVLSDKELPVVLGTSTSPAVYTPPQPPADVVATPDDTGTNMLGRTGSDTRAVTASTTATLRWKPPAKTGGMPVTGYRVNASPRGPSVVVRADQRQATLAGLDPGTDYTFVVAAVNAVGRAKSSTGLDRRAPTAQLARSLPTVSLQPRIRLRWSGRDDASGVVTYDVRYRRARHDGGLRPPVLLAQRTRSTSRRLSLKVGHTYCVQVRAHDRVGRIGAWSQSRCVSRPVDDRALARGRGWSLGAGRGFYLGTVSRSRRANAVLTLHREVTARRIWLVGTRCPRCGSVRVWHGGKYLGRVDLRAQRLHRRALSRLPVTTLRRGPVTIRTTSKRLVEIDAVAAARS